MFRFSLEAVLRQRVRQFEVAQMALAEVRRQELEIKELIKNLEKGRDEAAAELTARESRGLSVDEFLLRRWHLEGLYQRMREAMASLSRCRAEAVKRRGVLVEATKKKKTVERLKEKAWRQHLAQERAQEQKAIDEFAVLSFVRRKEAGRGRS